jgi:hypothetical protein
MVGIQPVAMFDPAPFHADEPEALQRDQGVLYGEPADAGEVSQRIAGMAGRGLEQGAQYGHLAPGAEHLFKQR